MSTPNKSLLTIGAATAAALTFALGYYYFSSSSKKETEKTTSSFTATKKDQVVVIDFAAFFNKESDPSAYIKECKKVADALHNYGVVCVKDPRVSETDNQRFINQMESYFEQSDGVRDARPQYSYQVGVTGELIEKPRDHSSKINTFDDNNKPWSATNPAYDPKWRFFWRIGSIPEKTEFPVQNMDPVIPEGFPEWKEIMDMWGNKMLNACVMLAEMAAVGFDMPKDTFTSRMKNGPHLLAPTGSNFNKYNEVGTVLAGFHYDMNIFTIHGKSRFPGLFVWTREGTKMPVAVPDGCLLVQVRSFFACIFVSLIIFIFCLC
jgi:isopenicillin N synthase-like dioxygenase